MFPFFVCHNNIAVFTVYGSTLESVGQSFPTANIYETNNLSNRLIRYNP